MRKALVNHLQLFGKSLFAPILLLPIIGLFIAFGNVFGNGNLAQYVSFLDFPLIQNTGKFISSSAVSILQNLALVFAVGIPIGLAKKDKGYAALTGLVTFVIFINAMHQILELTNRLVPAEAMRSAGQAIVLNVQVLEMGVFSGLFIGALVGVLHNKFCNTEFKGVLSIYSGHRFVAILAIPSAMILGALAAQFWPYAQTGITALANGIRGMGVFGFLVYGFLERILVPTGLHHLVYTPFLYTELGGIAHIGSETVYGARNIYFAEMADPTVSVLSSTVNWDARGLSKMFGLIGAALAMYVTANKDKKSIAKAILLPAAVTSFLLGVTEPLEFAFLFTAPILFVIHAVLTGIGMMLLSVFHVHAIGANGIIDFLLYNLPLGTTKSNWPMFILTGLMMTTIYFLVFRFLILKMNLKTPGREEAAETAAAPSPAKAPASGGAGGQPLPSPAASGNPSTQPLGATIIAALGGSGNIENIDNCYTRLRLILKDPDVINEGVLKETGSKGIIKSGNNVQVVYGLHVKTVRDQVDQQLGGI
ncbi:PTS system maltose and glucose-specific IIC component [Paenibacillus forsythiae]|uniref:PTS system maltose and glucose-specific IIC component n=1 Tax=Paenibacillus forsythiae TaxID=365616 RepID=A0ABU3H3M4_9BACL|nr:PTS transporter subunit EIIC [Paenibacillus forsythiae]MDT3425345.1 PTS system maltose and glucose-specific IIC component [Paenibacillus forsythiae]